MKAPPRFDRRAVARGTLCGLAVIVPVSLGQEVLLATVDDPCRDPVVFPVFLLILGAFAVAGYRAAQAAVASPYSHGLLAGLGAFAGWLPLKLGKNVIFGGSFVSDDCGADAGILSGIIGGVTVALLAMACGMAGSFLAARRRQAY